MRVVLAAAGTGGHINPAIAIANKIKQENPDAEMLFIGAGRELEQELVTRAGYKLKTITAYGLSSKLSLENVRRMKQTLLSISDAKKIISDFKPDIVIGTGGYICGPVFIAAKRHKIPTVLHESNAFPGRATKMLIGYTDTLLVGFQDAKKRLSNRDKIKVTGTPTKIRKLKLTTEERLKIINENQLDENLPIVLAFGGSQGAKAINDSLLGIIENRLNEKYQIVWAVGPEQYEVMSKTLAKKDKNIENIFNMKILPYIYNMEEMMNVCDLVIARSGAMTITEVSKVGKPAIFIPLPNVSQNHQEYNAKVLANVGAAEIVQNSDLTDSLLSSLIEKIALNPNKLMKMGELANSIAIDNVEEKIYIEIEKLLK